MDKIKYQYGTTEMRDEFNKMLKTNLPVFKLRMLGYISRDTVVFYHYIDAMVGKSVVLSVIELSKLSEMDFLKKNLVILMDVLIDGINVPKIFFPLSQKYSNDPESELNSANIKELALFMHKRIPDFYPLKDIIQPMMLCIDDAMVSEIEY